ncbi:MAG: hypothetical protein K9G30_08075 [Parvibaculum sp.]|nr:hypothetical protein [Parvibaculum sp.]
MLRRLQKWLTAFAIILTLAALFTLGQSRGRPNGDDNPAEALNTPPTNGHAALPSVNH